MGSLSVAGMATLLYGGLYESDRLTAETPTLVLPRWPDHLAGYRVGVLSDTHVRDRETRVLTKAACHWLVEQNPDMVVLTGDHVAYWKTHAAEWLEGALDPLKALEGRVLAVPGNHDYCGGPVENLNPVFERLGIRLLRNQAWIQDGIQWIGVDSAMEAQADPFTPIWEGDPTLPTVVIWHEGDAVDLLPRGFELMISGHSHGGQFTTPWGWAPMTTEMGSKYLRGYFPHAPTPLYVSRGIATTGPPARLFCRPEVTVLTLV